MDYSFISALASMIRVVTYCRVTLTAVELVATMVLLFVMAMRALAMAVLTLEKSNSLSSFSEGGLEPSRLRQCGIYLMYVCKSLGILRTYSLYIIGLRISKLQMLSC
jgi:hypothetical protein